MSLPRLTEEVILTGVDSCLFIGTGVAEPDPVGVGVFECSLSLVPLPLLKKFMSEAELNVDWPWTIRG